jgi:ABC-type lipoprotein release transport system permease subunit
VRLALGAQAAHVRRLVIGGALAIAAIGVGAGVLIALAAAPRLEPLLFDTSPRSPTVYAVVIAVLLATSLVAGAIPARRATRIDPVITLRA